MAQVSKAIILMLHILSFLFGFLVLRTGMKPRNSACDVYYRSPLVLMGYLIVALSFLGLYKNFCSVKVLRLYLLVIFAGILVMLIQVGIGMLMLSPGSDKITTSLEHRVGDFTPLLQQRVIKKWSDIRECIIRSNICTKFIPGLNNIDVGPGAAVKAAAAAGIDVVYLAALPLQRGCCLPPPACGLVRINGTLGYKTAPPAAANPFSFNYVDGDDEYDCDKWNNRWNQRCFDCERCKASFMAEVVWSWKKNFLLEMGFLMSLALILGISIRATLSHNGDNYNVEEDSYRESTVEHLPPGFLLVEID